MWYNAYTTFWIPWKWAISTNLNNSDILACENVLLFHFENFAPFQDHEFSSKCTESKCKRYSWHSKFSKILILLLSEISDGKSGLFFRNPSFFIETTRKIGRNFCRQQNQNFLKVQMLKICFALSFACFRSKLLILVSKSFLNVSNWPRIK